MEAFLAGRRMIVPLVLAKVGLNALIVGWPIVGWQIEVLYWCFISWWHLVARYLKTLLTFTSSLTDVRIKRHPRFRASISTSSLQYGGRDNIRSRTLWFTLHNHSVTHGETTAWSIRSILFWTITVGISPHSFSTFTFHSLTASKEARSVVLNVSTHAWAPL